MAARHRVMVLDWEVKCIKRIIPEQVTPKIKRWRLKDENIYIYIYIYRERVFSKIRLLESVQEWWE